MVNFTCNSCGDSLKKKDVVLHFSRNLKCRQAASLTCFDCLKEFGQNYTSHTVCVTEDQRYSANGLKGIEKTKQQVWNESAHQHLKSILASKDSSLSKSIVNLLEYLLNISNLPKKEKAFLNIVRNSKKFTENDARTAWNMVSEFMKQHESQANTDNTPKNSKSICKKSNVNGVAQSANGDTHTLEKAPESAEEVKASAEIRAEDEKSVSKGQKKKKKSQKAVAESSEEVKMGDTNEEISSDLKNKESKKQKKREKNESAETSQTNVHDATMEVEEQAFKVEGQEGSETKIEEEKLSKKEKKLKKKKEKYEAEMKALEAAKENEEQTEDFEEPATESGKKKKSKKQTLKADEDLETDKKSKKKRERTVSMAAEIEQPKKKNKQKGNDENTEPNEEIQETVPIRKEFNWADVIIQVLQSQNDNEMSVKRLCKKVVNEYLSSLLEGTHIDEVKATAKFQKKLQKTPGVFIHKDRAKLKV